MAAWIDVRKSTDKVMVEGRRIWVSWFDYGFRPSIYETIANLTIEGVVAIGGGAVEFVGEG
jgi:hypothetical protein